MLDIGWSELAIVAVLALIVIGPKDLPGVMRTVGQWVRKARSVSREFQSSIDEMIRESELDEARKAIQDTKSMNLDQTIEKTLDPEGEVTQSARELASETNRSPDAPAPATGDAPAEAGEPETKATIVKHPVSVAPPHSVTPPQPDSTPEPQPGEAAAATPSQGEGKTATGGSGA